MKMKKVICSIIILILIILITGIVYITASPEKSETKIEKSAHNPIQNTIEVGQVLDGTITDESGLLTEKEIEVIKQESQTMLNKHYELMFDFDEKTEDYTKEIQNHWLHDETILEKIPSSTKGVYPAFSGVHLNSEFQNTDIDWVLIRENTKYPEVSFHGVVNVHLECDKLEEGDYSILTYGILIKKDGEWKLCKEVINSVVQQGKYRHTLADVNEKTVKAETGKVLMRWDFDDVEGFLSDYKYDSDFEWDKYTEEGVFTIK